MICNHSELVTMQIAVPLVDGIHNREAFQPCDGVVALMIQQLPGIVGNRVLDTITISLFQDI